MVDHISNGLPMDYFHPLHLSNMTPVSPHPVTSLLRRFVKEAVSADFPSESSA